MLDHEMDWAKELENTVIKSLVTSFGLDFLLFEDKVGGNVDTVHNVRQNIYATDKERIKKEQQPEYVSSDYHSNDNYIKFNGQGKIAYQSNSLKDDYTGKIFTQNDKINLDHTISALEIHNDQGRILAELSGPDLANQSSNLNFTNETLNKTKKASTMTEFVHKLKNELDQTREKIAILENKQFLTNQEKQSLKKLKNKEKADFDKMLDIDKKARKKYDKSINTTYYTSSKFAKNVAKQSVISGFKMGTREMLGLILAEAWYELKDQLPVIYKNNKNNFSIKDFLNDICDVFKNIWERISIKFKDFLNSFKDGAISGAISSVTTTIINIFFTTQKMLGKIIRELWGNIVQVIKLIFFNPDSLSVGKLMKKASETIGVGISVLCGSVIYGSLSQLLVFPFGTELSAFCSTFASGVLILSISYYLENGKIPQKIWNYLDQFKSSYQRQLDYFKTVNTKLDLYLNEFAKLELNLDTKQLELFNLRILATNNELERCLILKEEIHRRNIELPFEAGNLDSLASWLKSL